jgi:cleavage and polyadenylation specificity factor subunit 2
MKDLDLNSELLRCYFSCSSQIPQSFIFLSQSSQLLAMLQLTPLASLPHNCLLLTLDSLTILLDASTRDARPPSNLPSQIDFVLLSHSTPAHINAFPRIALTHPHAQIYSTVPVATLGRLAALETTPSGPTVQDSVKTEDEYDYLTAKDVDKAFDRITTLRYSQPTILSHGITITAYPAGHSIGGTVWNIKKDQENIVVMVDWNHAKERIVGGMLDAKTLRLLERASCVITDVRGSSIPKVPTRKVREQFVIGMLHSNKTNSDSITSALTSEQSVLLPVLPPTRVLDLLLLLDNAFTTTPALQPFPIFYLARTSQRALSATRTMLEWLSQDITLQDHPLDFKHVKVVTQYSDLTQGRQGPRVVIVDGADLQEESYAHQAFLDFSSSGNLLLLTTQAVRPTSISGVLLQQWNTTSPDISPDTPRPVVGIQTTMDVTMVQRIPLQGDDLVQWRRADRMAKEQKDADLFFEERQRNLLEGTESDSDEDEEDQLILDVETSNTRIRGSAILLQDGTYDFFLGDVAGRASLKHFPFVDRRKRFDEFGVMFKLDEYIRVEDEPVAVKAKAVEVGRKRKWAEVETETEDIPARVHSSTVTVDINVRVGYVDLEGLHDGRAAGNLLPKLNARKIVLLLNTIVNSRLWSIHHQKTSKRSRQCGMILHASQGTS